MSASWRVIVEEAPETGVINMARDRSIQLAHAQGSVAPTLRIYRWSNPTATIGRFQSLVDVDAHVCLSEGIDVVRRFTGGRGVLHDDEITYSIVAGLRDGVPRGVAASYRMLSGMLLEAYRVLGVSAEMTARPRGRGGSAACYLHATRADLSVGEAKVSGSAQVWHEGTVLQHGSVVLSRDIGLESRVFRLDSRGRDELRASTTTLEELLGDRPAREDVTEALVRGLERALGVSVSPGDVSADESAREAALARTVVVELGDPGS